MTKIQTGRASKDYGVGRKCSFPGCKHTLSRYNPEDTCGHHVCVHSTGNREPQETKVCSCCKVEKPVSSFSKRKEGYESRCKECSSLKRRLKKDAALEEDGKRRCCQCNKVKVLSIHDWGVDLSDRTGFSKKCLDCSKEATLHN